MNRAERRKMAKTIPGYKDALKTATKDAVDNLEKMFQKNWKNDETLNEGERVRNQNWKDEIYND